MQNQSFLNRKITFTIFNRKEIQTNKRIDPIKKYGRMDAFDNDKAFWNEMTPALENSRGYFSRRIPITPYVWKHYDDTEQLDLLGDLKKRPLQEVVDEVRRLTHDVCVNNGFIDLTQIDWSAAYQAQEMTEIKEIEASEADVKKRKAIENKNHHKKGKLTVKK